MARFVQHYPHRNFLIFYILHKYYISLGGSSISIIGLRATIENPCISWRYWYSSISIASSLLLGHSNAPIFSRLYISRNPSPSHNNALILSFLRPQNKKSVSLSYGSRLNWNLTILAKPSIPLRKSVKPVYPQLIFILSFLFFPTIIV